MLASRYSVEPMVGEGTFAWVFAALDLEAVPPRRVALKVLRPELTGEGHALRQIEAREIAILYRVHAAGPAPNVVRALSPEVIAHRGFHVLVLEFIGGPSLGELLTGKKTLGRARARRIGAGIARGLAAIHAASGVHRDLKPTNVRLRAGDEPVILDLGIARAMQREESAVSSRRAWMTPRYAAPEQLAGGDAGPASDVYALGLILHEMLTGRLPGDATGPRRALPRDIERLILRCLARDPALRPAAAEVEAALSATLPKVAPVDAGRSRPVWSGVAILLLAGWMSASPALSDAPAQGALSLDPANDGDGPLPGQVWEGRPVFVRRFGDEANQGINGAAVDAEGNLWLTGMIRGAIDFGAVRLKGAGHDVFIAKLDPGGEILWARRYGDAYWQSSTDIALDRAGNAVITGDFAGDIDFGRGPLRNPAGADVFVAKLDPAGDALWSKRFGDESEQLGNRIAVDEAGAVLVTGAFSGTLDFGGGPLVSAGLHDVFLAKLDADGNTRWSKRFGDAGEQIASGLKVDAKGNILLTGSFQGAMELGGERLTSAGGADVFVSRFDADGHYLWSRRFGGPGDDGGRIGVVDAAGNVTVTGFFRGTLSLGSGRLTSAGGADTFVLRLDADGHPLWSRRFGGPGDDDKATVIDVDGEPIVIVALQDAVAPASGPRAFRGRDRLFAVRFDARGEPTWIQNVGGEIESNYGMVAAVRANDLFLAGNFEGTLKLGGPGSEMKSAGHGDIFLARFALAAEGSTKAPQETPR